MYDTNKYETVWFSSALSAGVVLVNLMSGKQRHMCKPQQYCVLSTLFSSLYWIMLQFDLHLYVFWICCSERNSVSVGWRLVGWDVGNSLAQYAQRLQTKRKLPWWTRGCAYHQTWMEWRYSLIEDPRNTVLVVRLYGHFSYVFKVLLRGVFLNQSGMLCRICRFIIDEVHVMFRSHSKNVRDCDS